MTPMDGRSGPVHSGVMSLIETPPPPLDPPGPPEQLREPEEPGQPGQPGDPGDPGTPQGLHRRSSHRMVAGVAGGIADRFDVDVTIVRVAFVVAACAWGLGIVVYLATWALVPSDRVPEPVDDGSVSGGGVNGTSWLSYVLLAGALFIGLMVTSAWWGGPRWGGGLGFTWLVVLFFAVIVALRRPARAPSFRRFLLVVALVLVSLIILVVGAFFGAMAVTGVPLTGGIGDRVVQPSSSAQLQPVYRLAAGTMTIDLTHTTFGPGPRDITASVGVGRLVIDVPPGAVVDVTAHSAIGAVAGVPAGPAGGGAAANPSGASRPRLTVDAQVGMGQVELERGGS